MQDDGNTNGSIQQAVELMRSALQLLDTANTDLRGADSYLQMAIDTASRSVPLDAGERIVDEAASLDLRKVDKALVRAIGGALSVFATLLSRQDIVSTGEVSELLGIYAVVTSEEDNAEGMILGCWAAMIRDLAERQGKRPS